MFNRSCALVSQAVWRSVITVVRPKFHPLCFAGPWPGVSGWAQRSPFENKLVQASSSSSHHSAKCSSVYSRILFFTISSSLFQLFFPLWSVLSLFLFFFFKLHYWLRTDGFLFFLLLFFYFSVAYKLRKWPHIERSELPHCLFVWQWLTTCVSQ